MQQVITCTDIQKIGSGLGPLDPGDPWHLSSLVQWVLRHCSSTVSHVETVFKHDDEHFNNQFNKYVKITLISHKSKYFFQI